MYPKDVRNTIVGTVLILILGSAILNNITNNAGWLLDGITFAKCITGLWIVGIIVIVASLIIGYNTWRN